MRKNKNAKIWLKNKKKAFQSKKEPNLFVSILTTLMKGPAGFTLIIAAIAYLTGVVDIRKEQLKLEKQELRLDIKNFKEEKESYTIKIDSLKRHLDSIDLEFARLIDIEQNYLEQKKLLKLEISQRKALETASSDSKNLLKAYKEKIEDYEARLLNYIETQAVQKVTRKINSENRNEIEMLLIPDSKEQTVVAKILTKKDGNLINFIVLLESNSSFRKKQYTIEIEDSKTKEKCWLYSNDHTGNKINFSGANNYTMSILVENNKRITRSFKTTEKVPNQIRIFNI